MKKNAVTTYVGFSTVKETITLEELIERIRSDKYSKIICKITRLIREGKTTEANNVKRQLDFFTVTALYKEKRLPESFEQHNDLFTIDVDGLTDEQVASLRPVIEQDATTIACFLTAKQHGYKILAYLRTPAAIELRKTYLEVETMTYAQLEKYHAHMYELNRIHYENLLGVSVDTSGKDISRGVFASFDPHAFYSPERAEKVEPIAVTITLPPPAEKKRGRKTSATKILSQATADIVGIDPVTRMEFHKCVANTRRTISYTEGNYNTFLFALGNKCFRKNLDEKMVKQLAAEKFGQGKWDTDTPISNAYRYVDKTEKAEQQVKEKSPIIVQVLSFLDERYHFRRNMILDRLEMRKLVPPDCKKGYHPLSVRDFNTIFLRMTQAGISFTQTNLRSVIDSEYAEDFDPFCEYFSSLPPWDGKTDFIGELADSIQAEDQDFWRHSFRCWLVSLVACATQPKEVNQQVLLLHGGQGKGKSTWIRKLLPPELREYYRNGMIDPGNKDDLLLLSTRLLINMEEFEGVKQGDIAEIKRLITQESITIRKPYDIQAQLYTRRASFAGSTNNMQFLKDIGGSRRFLVIRTKEIDYRIKINYTGVYSQAKYLKENGFRYWFEGAEIDEINVRNENHRMKDPIEENLYVYFNPATPRDLEVRWKPAAAILSILSVYGRTQANAQAQQILIQILERDNFMKRRNMHGITEYGVVELTLEQVSENFRRLEKGKEGTMEELPF